MQATARRLSVVSATSTPRRRLIRDVRPPRMHSAVPLATAVSLFLLASCSPQQPVSSTRSSLQFLDYYASGLPRAQWSQWPDLELSDFTFSDIPLVCVQTSSPNSYGNSFDVFVYYKANKDEPATDEWRQCLRFSARSYRELRLDFSAEHDRFRIYGIVPNDGHEELLLERGRFHESFTYYIPKHG